VETKGKILSETTLFWVNVVSAKRRERWQKASGKPRTKDEMKEAILNVLQANKGRILSTEELHKALPVRKAELFVFREAFNELVDEEKIKLHIGLP